MAAPSQLNFDPLGGLVTPDKFIERAIERAAQTGIDGLTPLERAVFLISELEVCCAKDGIDSFLCRHAPDVVGEAAAAFHSIGAVEIAAALSAIAESLPTPPETDLDLANRLISDCAGYDYDSIRRHVARELQNGAA